MAIYYYKPHVDVYTCIVHDVCFGGESGLLDHSGGATIKAERLSLQKALLTHSNEKATAYYNML